MFVTLRKVGIAACTNEVKQITGTSGSKVYPLHSTSSM